MPATTNEWIGLALATGLLLLLAAGLAVLGWWGLRALVSAARKAQFDDADGAWRAVSTGSAFSNESKPPPVPKQSVFLWLIRALAFLFVAPVAMIVQALRTADGKDGGEVGTPDTGANGLFGGYPLGALSITRTHPGPGTHYNARIGKCDDGTDPVGWYDDED